VAKEADSIALVEVTPEMQRAGLEELRAHQFGEDLGEVAMAVYMAMEYQRRSVLG
jgi:hypothetical protein